MHDSYKKLLNQIPNYTCFPTLEELDASSYALAQRYPDLVEVFSIGKSREGRDLLCIKIKGGKPTALCLGLPHPNEPIGTVTMEYLMETLATDETLREQLGYTWYFVKAWDADGYKRNEGWIKGPFTLTNYTRHWYRPVEREQVDFTFPIDYLQHHFHDILPETTAVKGLIEQIKPEFLYSLHNSFFSGVFWYLTHPMPSIYNQLHEAAAQVDLPIHMGDPEAPFCTVLDTAIYQDIDIPQAYDYLAKYSGKEMSTALQRGASSAYFAKNLCNTFTLVTELPYFYNEKLQDTTPLAVTRRKLVLESIEDYKTSSQFIRNTMDTIAPFVSKETPVWQALQSFTKADGFDALQHMVQSNPEYDKPATVAEAFDNGPINQFGILLRYGMLVQLIEHELTHMTQQHEEFFEKAQRLEGALAAACAAHGQLAETLERDMDYQVVPIQKLVHLQLNSALLAIDALKETH